MSLICRVRIGYFDAKAACRQRTILPAVPLDGEQFQQLPPEAALKPMGAGGEQHDA